MYLVIQELCSCTLEISCWRYVAASCTFHTALAPSYTHATYTLFLLPLPLWSFLGFVAPAISVPPYAYTSLGPCPKSHTCSARVVGNSSTLGFVHCDLTGRRARGALQCPDLSRTPSSSTTVLTVADPSLSRVLFEAKEALKLLGYKMHDSQGFAEQSC